MTRLKLHHMKLKTKEFMRKDDVTTYSFSTKELHPSTIPRRYYLITKDNYIDVNTIFTLRDKWGERMNKEITLKELFGDNTYIVEYRDNKDILLEK